MRSTLAPRTPAGNAVSMSISGFSRKALSCAALALASGCFFLLPGAVRPPSNGAMKQSALSSTLFKSLDVFYADRDTIGSHPAFSRGQIGTLRAIMQGAVDTIRRD